MNTQAEIGSESEKPTRWQAIQRWILAVDGGIDYDPNEYTYNRLIDLSRKVDGIESRLVELESERKS